MHGSFIGNCKCRKSKERVVIWMFISESKKKGFKKVILWSVQILVDSTTVCLTENVKIQLYEEKLFLLELSKMNIKVGLFHASDNVLADDKNSCKTSTL